MVGVKKIHNGTYFDGGSIYWLWYVVYHDVKLELTSWYAPICEPRTYFTQSINND